MIEPILVISTIIMVLLMGIVAVLAVIFALRKPTSLNKGLRALSILLLCYMLAAFMQYYFQQNALSLNWIKFLGCLSDICYFMFIISWIYIIKEFSGNLEGLKMKVIILVTAVYGVSAEVIVIFKGHYGDGGQSFVIESDAFRNILLIINGGYAIAIILLSVSQFFMSIAQQEKGYKKKGTLFFSGTLALYMLWILLFDYSNLHHVLDKFMANVIIDPLLVFYCTLAIAIILFFFKNDPLDLLSEQNELNQKEQLRIFAEEKKLTKRETEVLEMVCQGYNNPEIAEQLCISKYTVKRHLNNIFQKSNVTSRYELISNILQK